MTLKALGHLWAPFREPHGDLSGCEVWRQDCKPWLLKIVEPLGTHAPHNAQPFCCYIDTVIFYRHPHETTPDGCNFVEYGRVETLLRQDDILEFGGEAFIVTSGSVCWEAGRWVMVYGLRRLAELPAHLEAAA